MSLQPIESIADAITKSPSDLEQRLTTAMRTVARRSVETPKVRAALAAAEALPVGLVITSEDAAATVVDAVATLISGEKQLAADLKEILRIPDAMDAAARGAMAVERTRLAAAKERGNNARVAFQQLVRKQAAEAEALARENARKAAEAAALAAAEMGDDDIPPEAEVAPVQVARTVTAGSAKSGTTVRIEAQEIVDDAACPKDWKVIVRAVAEASFRAAEQQGKVKRAAPGESIVWMGVRFLSNERAANR